MIMVSVVDKVIILYVYVKFSFMLFAITLLIAYFFHERVYNYNTHAVRHATV